MSDNTYPFNAALIEPSVPLSDHIGKMLDTTSDSQNITLDQVRKGLRLFQSVLQECPSKGDINLAPYFADHEIAVTVVLMYNSIYPTERKKIEIKLRSESVVPRKNKLKPVVKARMKECPVSSAASCSSSEDEDGEYARERELPPMLRSVDTRGDNSGVLDAFNSLVAERSLGLIRRRRRRAPKIDKYLVNYQKLMDKLTDLIEVFDFFRDYDQYSGMVFRLRKIMTECRADVERKYSAYKHVSDIKDKISDWCKQSRAITESMSKFNDTTLRSKSNEEYVRNLDCMYNDGIRSLIDNLPVERVARELELAKGVASVCATLLQPQMQSAGVQCPICFGVHDKSIYAMPCGHVVCGECLAQLTPIRNAELQCPTCRNDFEKTKAIKLFITTE